MDRQILEHAVLEIAKKAEEMVDEKLKKIQELENMGENELDLIRERRLQALKKQKEKQDQLRFLGHGEYRVCSDEKDFFAQAKTSDKLVVHFGRPSTRRCEIVDGHLNKLCKSHLETKFLYCNAEKSPFLAERLEIIVLPSLVLVKNGKVVDILIGFESFGKRDDFTTLELERVLFEKKVIDNISSNNSNNNNKKFNDEDEEGGDW